MRRSPGRVSGVMAWRKNDLEGVYLGMRYEWSGGDDGRRLGPLSVARGCSCGINVEQYLTLL